MMTSQLIHTTMSGVGKLLSLCAVMLVLGSCGEDIDVFVPRTSSAVQGNADHLLDQLATSGSPGISQTFTCPCEGGRAFKSGDLIIDIPADFVDLSAYPCPEGQFSLEINVLDTKGEILLAGIPTVSEGKLVESRMQFHVAVLSDQQPVQLAPGKQIRVLVQDPDPRERMELFYGWDLSWLQADNDPAIWDNVMPAEWSLLADTEQGPGQFVYGSGYESLSDKLDWMGIQVFFNFPADQLTDVCIELPDEFTYQNTAIFMVCRDYKSLLRLEGDAEDMQFCSPYNAIPIGHRVTFIVLTEMGPDDYRFAVRETILTANHSEYIQPLKTPYDEILNYLTNL